MEIEYFNMEQLVKIVVKDKQQSKEFNYCEVNKTFWGWVFDYNTNESGYYDIFNGCYSKEELENGQYHNVKFIIDDINKKVYYRPCVSLVFTNDEAFYKVFDTFEEALAYGEEISKKYIKKVFILK